MEETRKSSPAMIAIAWIIVGVPLGWGVYKSALNAVKLFQPQPAATAPPRRSSRGSAFSILRTLREDCGLLLHERSDFVSQQRDRTQHLVVRQRHLRTSSG